MTGTNYTNPNDRGRFGFSESGEFKAPFKGGFIFAALFIAAGVCLDVIMFFVIVNAARQFHDNPDLKLFTALVEGFVMLLVVTFTVLLTGIGLRIVTGGFTCKYTANDEKFVLTIGGDVHTIYYREVQAVHFLPRTAFGKVSGYDVTIKVNGADEKYAIVSEGFLAERNTPFNIIRERAEMLRNAEALERVEAGIKNSLEESKKPILAEDIAKAREGKKDVFDRMAEMLGKDAEMPGVSLANDERNTARAVRAYKAEQEARASNAPVIPEGIEGGYDIAKVMEKVSPTVGGYAADMPSLDKDGKVIASLQTYIGADGRELSLDDVIGRGTFHVPLSKKAAVPLWITVGVLMAWALFVAFLIVVIGITNIFSIVGAFFFSAQFHVMTISALLALTAAIVIIKFIRQGIEYSYKANGREFVVTAKNKPEEHIYYNEVAGVTYSKRKFLWFENGYNVDILTRYGVIKYQYIYPKFRHPIKTEDLPFELIRQKIEKQKPISRG